jgi:penicillin-binding protein 2
MILAACSGGDGGGSSVAVPLLQAAQKPDEVVSGFLNNWKAKDYPAMYNTLSSQSQGFYTLPVFQKIYDDVARTITLDDLSFKINDTQIQGASAAVTYDVSLVSPIFGTIDDKGRTMRLIQKPGGWGIAWSSMDIFDALAAGARLEVRSKQPPRGNIYDRNGKLLVEQNGTVIALYVAKNQMANVDECLSLLATVLMEQRYELAKTFASNNAETVFYAGDIDPETDTQRGGELDSTCAVKRFQRQTRRYVGHGAAVHLTGYIGQMPASQVELYKNRGYNPGDLVGLSGVEAAYEEQLSGKAEKVLRIVDTSGLTLRELGGKQGSPSQSVTLTIDRDLQMATSQALADAFNYAEPNWAAPGISTGAMAVVLDVKTGAILALASYPFYDPGIFNPDTPAAAGQLISSLSADVRQPFKNRATQEQYFPGSTFKIITAVAAASEGVMTEPTFFCDLKWNGKQYGDTLPSRSDWRVLEKDKPAAGEITMAQAITASCNPFFYEMGARLYVNKGPETLFKYARLLGLGVKTGVEPIMPEVPGKLQTPTSVEQAINNGIGQGELQVTPIQMARMVAAIANGGTIYRPYVVLKVGGDNGTPVTFQGQPTVVSKAGISAQVLDVVHEGMCAVTTDKVLGTAWFDFEKTNYVACGKTGTAQTGRREPNGWFVSYAPKDNPEIAVVVMGEYSREGSEVAGPIARRIIDVYLKQPQAPYPRWWNSGPYVPLDIPVGTTGG